MELKRYLPILTSFQDQTVLVVGDLILDEYLLTSTGRVSREAPVLVTDFESSHHCLGGAGNVIMNLHQLGARVIPAGFLGDDRTADIICSTLAEAGIAHQALIRVKGGITPKKSRILAGASHTRKQQILRIDYTSPLPIDESHRLQLKRNVQAGLGKAGTVILSDYLNQSATADTVTELRSLGRSLPIVADSRHHIRSFRGSTYITPNEEEFCALLESRPESDDGFHSAARDLIRDLNLEGIILKRGHLGMMAYDRNGASLSIPVHGTSQIVDVTGAGDTVIAVACLGIACGLSLFDSARLSNVAASLVVMREGAYALPQDELRNELRKNS